MNRFAGPRGLWSIGLSLGLGVGVGACTDEVAPERAAAKYLVAHGTWVLDDSEQSFSDPRNPKRLVLTSTDAPNSPSVFSFYADVAGKTPLAEGCAYQYNRSQPDSYRFPASKESVWLVFDLEPGSAAACQAFQRVAFAPTLAGDGGLHLRYGDIDYDVLVGATYSDPASPELWWSVYAPVSGARTSADFPYAVANGERVLDPTSTEAQDDARNPSRVVMETSAASGSESRFVFYVHGKPNEIWADCNFQVRYTMPDPSAFPADKLALWDAYEMTGTRSGACASFSHVVMFWPDGAASGSGAGAPMQLRYGTEGFLPLLSNSLASEPGGPWWARYCGPNATKGCASDF